jgi:hypothetical protein
MGSVFEFEPICSHRGQHVSFGRKPHGIPELWVEQWFSADEIDNRLVCGTLGQNFLDKLIRQISAARQAFVAHVLHGTHWTGEVTSICQKNSEASREWD